MDVRETESDVAEGKKLDMGRSLMTRANSHTQQLTQSSWCEEAGEDKQACGPHGLLFLPPAAEGPR